MRRGFKRSNILIFSLLLGNVILQATGGAVGGGGTINNNNNNPMNALCRYNCAQCNYNSMGNYCSVCSNSRISGTNRFKARCSGRSIPGCIYDSYASGLNRCSFCQIGYALTQQGTCVRFNQFSPGLSNCDIAWVDTRGRFHCSGCKLGYSMNNRYQCHYGTVVPNCEVHGYDFSQSNRIIRCIQCRDNYYLTRTGTCSRISSSYRGCFTPDLNGRKGECFFCDGYHGYLESGIKRVAGNLAYKICTRQGINWGRTGYRASHYSSTKILGGYLLGLVLLIVLFSTS